VAGVVGGLGSLAAFGVAEFRAKSETERERESTKRRKENRDREPRAKS
jgi:hypothetical protein